MSTHFDRPELPALGVVSGMKEEDRQLLSNYGEFLPVQEGDSLIEEGADQDSLVFLISGLLHVVTNKDGKLVLLARVEPGTSIGEVNLFDPAKASASVVAKSFSQVWKIRRNDLDDFLNAYPEAASHLMIGLLSEMSKRLRNMNQKLSNTELQNALQEFFH
ncbi:MAG: cyclic nucleotide-binding domain-containing protein [Roseibacillus sp.]|nr:cyclic nucleotide-binding domain-containing protein [Roseibacillus sp.]